MDDDSSLSDLSSDLSSVRSLSPPFAYPSPVSSQDQDNSNGSHELGSQKRAHGDGGEPVAKKRKQHEPKPRTTQYLNLTSGTDLSATEQKTQCDILLRVLRKRRKIVVIAGAGISVSAGIPDFRSSTGLFTTLRSEHKLKSSGKHLFDASVYQTDDSTSSFHDMVRSLSNLVSVAKPTAFHQMLSTLGSEGRLMRLYTQNVDGIDVALPSLETSVPLSSKGPWPRAIQLHGGLEKMVCTKCRHLSEFVPELFSGPEPPLCTVCVETDRVRTNHAGKRSHGIGRLRPRIVLYNEHNPDEDAIGAVVGADLRSRPDAVIVVGTSMKIPGVRRIVREMCGVVRGRRDGLAVWINQDAPPLGKEFEDCWDLVVKGPCDEVARQWNHRNGDDSKETTESEVERVKKRCGEIQVMIGPKEEQQSLEGILTPAASPQPKKAKIGRPRLKIKLNLSPPTTTDQNGKSSNSTANLAGSRPKKPAGKATAKTRKVTNKAVSTASAPRIDSLFKVVKGVPMPSQKANLKPSDTYNDSMFTAMAPISPSAARNNGPLDSIRSIFPNLKPVPLAIATPSKNWNRRRSETLSPTGSIPKDMERLLN